ncbi:MAG TPA: YceI family protein [Acidimicrobiia bacterium]|nr:YceI family protein [Acidimicrobiia bacterium]
MNQTQATLPVEGLALPEPGDWKLDAVHTSVTFTARQLMVSKVRGKFTEVSGAIHISRDPAHSWVEVKIDPATVETGNEKRDAHLRSPDFFGVQRYPEITFRSTQIEGSSRARFLVHGDLTVHGVTRPVMLDVAYPGPATDPPGGRWAVFSATTVVDRRDFGVTWNAALEGGGLVVGRKIRLELEVEALKQF